LSEYKEIYEGKYGVKIIFEFCNTQNL